jgi:uracil-DNA glycosylase
MEPDCEGAVFGYGDANADFHVIGDHPGVHGGLETGIPFTGTPAGERLQRVLVAVGLLSTGVDPGKLTPRNCFLSYLHMCPTDCGEDATLDSSTDSGAPAPESYANLERFFDAELRAIAAHVLLPVGQRAIRYVLDHYTAQGSRYDSPDDLEPLHAEELHGSGFLVLPISDPDDWTEHDEQELEAALETVLDREYRQISDLGRFMATDDPYLVR